MPNCELCKETAVRRVNLKKIGKHNTDPEMVSLMGRWKSMACSKCFNNVKDTVILAAPEVPKHAVKNSYCGKCDQSKFLMDSIIKTKDVKFWNSLHESCLKCLNSCRGRECSKYQITSQRLLRLMVKNMPKAPRTPVRNEFPAVPTHKIE